MRQVPEETSGCAREGTRQQPKSPAKPKKKGQKEMRVTTAGKNRTRPFIAAAGGQDDRVRLLDRVANGGKRMLDHGLRCEHGYDQNRQHVIHG